MDKCSRINVKLPQRTCRRCDSENMSGVDLTLDDLGSSKTQCVKRVTATDR